MERKEYLVEITYSDSGNKEVETIKTDDLAWSMNQYQRNRLPLITLSIHTWIPPTPTTPPTTTCTTSWACLSWTMLGTASIAACLPMGKRAVANRTV